jgi:RNA-directed DNA polymerase
MPGVDGISPDAWRRDLHRHLQRLGQELAAQTYRPLPLLGCLMAAADGSPRPIFMATVRDRTAQAAVVNVIEPILEARYEEDPLSHRKSGCVRHAAGRVRELWDEGFTTLVNAGVASFFDHLDHEAILDRLRALIDDSPTVSLIEQWICAPVYDGDRLFRLESGIPWGTVPAPTLGKLFLDTLDEALGRCGQQMIRYGHDLIVVAKSPEHADGALEITPEILSFLELAVDPEDPRITEFWRELQALGFLLSGDGILAPFDRSPPPRTLLHVPPPLDYAVESASGARTE